MIFAKMTAKENTPNREREIIFNSLNIFPKINYIIAIKKILHSKIYYQNLLQAFYATNVVYVLSNHEKLK